MRVGLAADHEGYELKVQLLDSLRQLNFQVTDFGAVNLNPDDDYPDFIVPLAQAVGKKEIDRGIAICGSGIGACIASNKVKNVRAGIIQDDFSARQGVEDDDMNIICIGSRLVEFKLALELVKIFLATDFSGKPRHIRRIAEISHLELAERTQ